MECGVGRLVNGVVMNPCFIQPQAYPYGVDEMHGVKVHVLGKGST